MGQGLTNAPLIYTELKDIMSGAILELYLEPLLTDCYKHSVFEYFVDDDAGGSRDV
jgi:hypothetical protein